MSPRTPALNLRLWLIVGLVLLLVPGVLVGLRARSRPAAAPAVSSSSPEASSTPASEPRSTRREKASKPPKRAASTVPRTGPQKYVTAAYRHTPAHPRGRLIKYAVKVEKNLPLDADEVAREVAATLEDPRSWGGNGSVTFALVAPKDAELTVYLLTPGSTDRRCAPLRTMGKVSCQQGRGVNLNAVRWVHGVRYYGDDLTGYRHYLVNHEVGHYLGHGHVGCPGRGRKAPIMMQQTKGLGGCRPNPWVRP